MTQETYISDYYLKYGIPVDLLVSVYAKRFNLSPDEAAKMALNPKEYQDWLQRNNGSK